MYRKVKNGSSWIMANKRYTFISSEEDMQWLREVHLPQLAPKFKSAVLYGNEDAPDQIECYLSVNPNVADWPEIWIPSED